MIIDVIVLMVMRIIGNELVTEWDRESNEINGKKSKNKIGISIWMTN
jgi:hypothetical protein